jgi:hypothetical protein
MLSMAQGPARRGAEAVRARYERTFCARIGAQETKRLIRSVER